jgi:N-carbamoylputrescine amidase
MHVACAQMTGCGGSIDERLSRIAEHARGAASGGAQLLVLPEMSVPGYELRHDMVAEPVPGRTTRALAEIARAHDIFLVAGATELEAGSRYNTLLLAGPDGLVGRYRKLHVSAVENAYWRSGREPTVLECDLGRIGFGICADMIFESPWRGYRGAVDLVVIGAAWPDHSFTRPFPYGDWFARTHVEATRAVPVHLSRAVGVPVVLANAAGSFAARLPPFGSALSGRFAGRSCIVDHDVLARAGVDEQLISASVDAKARTPSVELEPWIPSWSKRFRIAAAGGDIALGALYRAFYRT